MAEKWEDAGLIRKDITSETWREYIYTDGFVIRVEAPVRLYIKKSEKGDSHRVIDTAGTTHYVPVGWRTLRWNADPEVEF